MPALEGPDVKNRFRADASPAVAQIPTIMLTGHGGEESEVLCLEAGADDFVTKPINEAVLRARVDTQLRPRSMRRELQEKKDELGAGGGKMGRDLGGGRPNPQTLLPPKTPRLP